MSATLFFQTTSACPSYSRSQLVYKLLKKAGNKAPPVLVRVSPVRCASSGKSPAKMQAWLIHQYGDNKELTLSEKARAATIKAPNELLIKVHAASVNPIDVRMRGGYGSKIMNVLRQRQGGLTGSEFPLILGRDFSGTVIETGQAVRRFKPGDEVWGALNGFRQGSHAQFAVASESEISKKPKSLSHEESASIPYVAATAWAALCTVGELKEKKVAGKRILIQGGSGGIGTFSIQGLTGGQSYRWAFFLPNGRALERVSQMVDSGQIQPVVEKAFPFSDLPEAYQHVEQGHNRGKTVVRVTESS